MTDIDESRANYKRHSKDKMNEDSKQEFTVLIAKKSERLVTALYLVTDLLIDSEPIKHGLRQNSVALLSSMNTLSQVDSKDRFSEYRRSLKAVTEILSLLQVAGTSGVVSEMNDKLLMDGFRSLQMVLEKQQPVLTEDMLRIDDEERLSAGQAVGGAITSTSYDVITPRTLTRLHSNQRDIRSTVESLRQDRLLAKLKGGKSSVRESLGRQERGVLSRDGEDLSVKDIAEDSRGLSVNHASNVSQMQPSSSFQIRKHSRREQILGLFVRGVDVSIKDIATRIKGCSEKTIQRELNALLEDKVIDRIGEKRWSRYVLR